MINDFKAVFWKEWREHILQYGSVGRWMGNMAILIGLVGIFLPLQFGRAVVESVLLFFWLWIPLLTVTNAIADSVAGERERHTLETLLASRLPDRAIVMGKIAVPVLQSWLGMLIAAMLALITVNLTKGEGEFIMYPTPVVLGIILIPLLAGLFISGLGVIASTHATTVRQAYQRMLVPLFVLIVVPSVGFSLLSSDLVTQLYSPEFAQNSLGGVILIVVLLLLGIDVVILAAALRRFNRSNLISV